MDSMMTQTMGHAAFYYPDNRHFAHHPAMPHMPMYTLPSTPVYARPSSACSQPMVPTLYSNAPSAMTPTGSPAPLAHKPSMLDTEVRPSTPPLSTSGSVISSPGACDMLQTPMNPMFSGLDGIEGLKADFEPETTFIQEWNTGCASPPMTPVYLGQQQAKTVAVNSSFSSDLLSTASCPSLSPSPSPYARSVASTDEDVSFCDPRNLTVGTSPSNPTLATEFHPLPGQQYSAVSSDVVPEPLFDLSAPVPPPQDFSSFDSLSELDSDEDFSQLISLPTASDVRRPRACTGSSVVSLSHSFICDDDLCFEESFQADYMPSPPSSGSEDDGHETKRLKKCNGLKAAPCKVNMAAGSADSSVSTHESGNQATVSDSKSSSSSEGSTPLPAPVNRRGRKQSLTEDPSKTFVCDICFRRFRRQEHLKRHYRSLHTQDKPFECNECGKKFSRSDNLAQHARTHGSGAIVMDILDEATMHNMAMLGHHHPEDFHNMGKVLFQVAAEIPGSASELSSEDGMSDHGRKKRKRSE